MRLGKPDWRDTLKVGDVLITPSRDLRVVRGVSFKGKYVRSITLAIRHCSWTGRAHTTIGRSDLQWRGFNKAGVRARLDGPLDEKFRQDIQYDNRFTPCLTCHDARVIA